MALGNNIILSSEPRGVFKEGYLTGALLPGTLLQLDVSETPIAGRHWWEAYAPGTDGEQRLVAVLLEDALQGKTAADAYVTGNRCFIYCPAPGEELNVRVSAAGTGTGNAIAIGAVLTVNTGDGLLIATTSTPEMEPFVAMEAVSDVVAAGTLVHCMYTGK